MIGIFLSFDIVLFYVFFELSLVPLFFLIGIWGGPQRQYAGPQVLHLHPDGQPADAAGRAGRRDRLPGRRPASLTFSIPELVELVHARPGRAPSKPTSALLDATAAWVFLAPDGRLRRQGAAGALPHLAAAGPRRGADGRQRGPGRRAPQGRRLRLLAAGIPLAPDASLAWACRW